MVVCATIRHNPEIEYELADDVGALVIMNWKITHNVHIANVVTIDILIHVDDWYVCGMIIMIVL